MKHFTLIESFSQGKKTWRLLGLDGQPLAPFDLFAQALLRKSPVNTRESYCRHVALFLDYLAEAGELLAETTDQVAFRKTQLVDVIDSFPDWMIAGGSGVTEMAKTLAARYPSPMVKGATADLAMSAVKKFLKLSERIRRQLEELESVGLASGFVDKHELIPGLGEQRELTRFERQAMLTRSMMAGVLSGGPRLIEACVFPTVVATTPYFNTDRAFPFDKVPALIDAFTTHRDKAMYALMAATGCRGHEAFQLLLDDIDIAKRTVKLVDPFSRPEHPSYLALPAAQREKLAWKGRETEETLLIQPFADMFFTHLEAYLRHEYLPHGKHRFVFQYSVAGDPGRPYFLCSRPSQAEVFNLAAKKSALDAVLPNGKHSLRHMYGVYLLNYFPRSDGTYGLPMPMVQKLMGHATQGATEKYARHDQDLIQAELEYANALVFGTKTPMTLLEMKRGALLRQLAEVEQAMGQPALKGSV